MLIPSRLGSAYPHARLGKYLDSRGIRVAFLSTLPISSFDDIQQFGPDTLTSFVDSSGRPIRRFGRGPLRVRVALGSRRWIDLLTVHLKSKLISYPGDRFFPLNEDERARETGIALSRRTAEAVALRVYINELLTGNERPMVVLGDMNDEPGAVTNAIILGPEDGSLDVRDRFDDIRLYNVAQYIASERRFSRIYRQRRELIDHILVSHELIFRLRLADSFVEPIQSIGASPMARRDEAFPDHAPVYARFELE
jgi:Endonuclease/Exonuclease/phosphatase family